MINAAVINWWRTQNIQTKDDLRVVLENFSIVFATNSNSIEGNRLTYHETRDIFEGKDLSINEVNAREIFEAQNQKFAFERFLEYFEKKEPLSIEIMLEFHRILISGCLGEGVYERGEARGIDQERISIVTRLLSQGKSIEEIENLTGYSKSFIIDTKELGMTAMLHLDKF